MYSLKKDNQASFLHYNTIQPPVQLKAEIPTRIYHLIRVEADRSAGLQLFKRPFRFILS